MKKNDPRNLLINITQILNDLKIPYLITGGIAVFIWGRPRFTADIDLIIELFQKDLSNLERALRRLSKSAYVDVDMMGEALRTYGEFNFIDGESGVKVDFWIAKNDEFDQSRFKRRIIKKVFGKSLYLTSPEDLILIKLKWYQESQSNRHLEDVESIFNNCGERLDRKYLEKWVVKLGVRELLSN